MEILVILFAVIGLLTCIILGIGILFINPIDDRDCLSESDLWNKYHKGK